MCTTFSPPTQDTFSRGGAGNETEKIKCHLGQAYQDVVTGQKYVGNHMLMQQNKEACIVLLNLPSEVQTANEVDGCPSIFIW